SNFVDGYHEYSIVQGGLHVYPRLVAAEFHREFDRISMPSGIVGLDKMLGGGLASGTTTLIIGPAGAGQSTIAMPDVANALEHGLNCAVYAFDEVLDTLFERTEKLCSQGLRQFAKDGKLHVQQIDPAEMPPGEFAWEIRRSVEEQGVRFVVIDSLNGYMAAMQDNKYTASHLHEMFAYLNQQGIVTIFVVATHGLLGTNIADLDVSYLADTIL